MELMSLNSPAVRAGKFFCSAFLDAGPTGPRDVDEGQGLEAAYLRRKFPLARALRAEGRKGEVQATFLNDKRPLQERADLTELGGV
mmetsp:Transcript_52516/g.107733  ORF Transcript_52516/g.107733 Transcript_52516/m.107733 type:complete len:86 (-) Transcript_52516:78-335(-)